MSTRRPDDDFAAEIRAHLELEQGRLEDEGLSDADARAAARQVFGNLTAAEERYHESGRWTSAGNLLRDCGYACRMLRKTPWFTAAAVVILAIAIGASLAVFRLIDALLLRAIPVAHPEQLVHVNPVGPQGRSEGMPSTVLDGLRGEPVFSGVCGFTTPRVTTNINGAIASTGTLEMTGDCFQTLGVRTQIGRAFTLEDDLPESPNVTVLTARLWRKAFGGSAGVIGKQIQAGAETYTVIGVAADDFTGVLLGFEPGLIIPLHHTPTDVPSQRFFKYYWVSVFARLAPGVSKQSARARVAVRTSALLAMSVPARYNAAQRRVYLANHLAVTSARTGVDWMLRERFGRPLVALFGICVAILLIACLNLAGLLVSRTLARQKELGIRMAIGGTPWRVMRPLAFESMLLAIAGGITGVLCASWMSHAMASGASAMFPNFTMDASLNGRALALLGGMIVWVAGVLSIVPVWQARRSARTGSLRAAGRGVVGSSARSQKVLIGIQVACTLALVTAGGMFASSFTRLAHLPLGLHPEGVAQSMLAPLPGGYGFENPQPYYSALLERVSTLPGVESASLSSFALYWQMLFPEPVRGEEAGRELHTQTIRISDGYFRTIGVRLLAGEDFSRDRTAPEAIVSESVARMFGGSMLGRYILVGEAGSAARYRVIGVAPTMRISMQDPRTSNPFVVYLSFWQNPKELRYPALLVKGAHGAPDARALAAAVQAMGHEYIEEHSTIEASLNESIVEDRLLAYLASAFGLLALVLAAIGLFAILSVYVARRTGEIGVRMALGATGAQICRLILGQIGTVMLVGIGAGLALAITAGRIIARFTYGATPGDPWLLGAAVAALVVTALVAAWLPARRAASIQPLEALRQE